MSRQQGNKSREKPSRGGGGAQSVPIPAVTTDVVPGRVTNADWSKICATDDDDEYIGSLVEEIVESTLEKCYEKYIAKQVIPFTVMKAKDELLNLIEWRFLSHDSGEKNIELNNAWEEDAEPDPGIIDSWAQGSVPIILKRQPVHEIQTVVKAQSEKEDEQTVDDATETISLATELATPATEEDKKSALPTPRDEKQTSPAQKSTRKKIKYKKYTGRLPSAHLGEMNQTLEQTESQLMARDISALDINKSPGSHLPMSQKSFLKLQAGRPPGNKDVTFDERGNVIAVMKLDNKSFPTHRVRVGYQIVDPEAEAAAQRLEAMRTGKLRNLAPVTSRPKPGIALLSPRRLNCKTSEKPKANYPLPPLHQRNNRGRYHGIRQPVKRTAANSRNYPPTQSRPYQDSYSEPLPPSLIDSIDASPGVVITEGDQVKVGSRSKSPSSQVYAPGISDEGSIVGSVTVSTKGSRTLRLLGAPSSSGSNDARIRPILSPSQVLAGSPNVTSPFSVSSPSQAMTSSTQLMTSS